MEIKTIFQLISYEYEEEIIEIQSPNNELYERKAEELEEKITRIIAQKQRGYQDSSDVIIY